MRELKLQLNILSPRDYLRIEKHLSDMAAKGWFLEQNGSVFWRYRIGQPKKLRYSVLFFQNLDWEQPYTQMCQEAGWTFVTGFAGMQIFCTEDPDLEPVEVAPATRWKALHNATMKRDKLLWLGMCLLALVVLLNSAFTAIADPVEVLADGPRLMYALLMIAVVIFLLWDILHYYHWRFKARRQFNKIGTIPEPRGNFIGICVGLGILAVLLVVTLVLEDPYGRLVTFLNIATILLSLLAVSAYILLKKRKSADAPVSSMMCITIALVTFLLLGMLQSVAVDSYDFTCAPEDMDLTVQTLTGETVQEQSCLTEEQSSPFLQDLTGRNIVGQEPEQQILQYRITKAVRPELIQFCYDNCLPSRFYSQLAAQDTSLWQAQGVWLHEGSNGMYTYYIYYSDRAATLMVNWLLTEEQVAIATQALQNA